MQRRKGSGPHPVGIRPRPRGDPPGRVLLHNRIGTWPSRDHHLLNRPLEHRNDISRSTLLLAPGVSPWLVPVDGLADHTVFVRSLLRGGVALLSSPDGPAVCGRQVARQGGSDVLRRARGGASMGLVGGSFFTGQRRPGHRKTPTPFTRNAVRGFDTGCIAPGKVHPSSLGRDEGTSESNSRR